MRIPSRWLTVFLLAPLTFARMPSPAAEALQEGFPAALLQGLEDFDLALSFQGDLRGNVGPCG